MEDIIIDKMVISGLKDRYNDFRKVINVIVIIISGFVATLGYNYIPYKAYVIVAGLAGLLIAIILTKVMKNNE